MAFIRIGRGEKEQGRPASARPPFSWKNEFSRAGRSRLEFDAADAVSLPAGARPFVLEYLEGMGPPTLEVMVEGPGVERQRVPATMLWRRPG